MTVIIATILLCCLIGVWTLFPLWTVEADRDPGDGLEAVDRLSAWREEKDRLVGELVALDVAFSEQKIDDGDYQLERERVVSEAEHASAELSKARAAQAAAERPAQTYPRLAATMAVALVVGTVALTIGLDRQDIRSNSNPHADGRIPLPSDVGKAGAASGESRTSPGNLSLRPDGTPDVGAMVAKLENRVKAGNASIDDVMMLARSYRVLDRETESLAMYRQARSMAPGEQAIELVLASALLRTGTDPDRDEATEIVEKVLTDDPAKPEALWLKGLGLIRRHEIQQARDILTKLTGLVGENSAAKKAVVGLLAELDASASSLRKIPGAAGEHAPAASAAPATPKEPPAK